MQRLLMLVKTRITMSSIIDRRRQLDRRARVCRVSVEKTPMNWALIRTLTRHQRRGVHGNGENWDPMGPMGFPWEWELRRGSCHQQL